MKAADLKKSILQYAVEGKLVPQDIHDEPASLLYDKIIKEKEILLKQGKIKKEKPLPPITDDEIPYDIPNNWKWVRLGEIIANIDGAIKRGPFGSAIKKEIFVPYAKNTYKVYEQGNAIRKSIDYGNYFITENDYKRLKSFKISAGDIIISCAGTLGETYILPENAYPGIINQALLKITLNPNIINKKFFLIIFQTITQNEIRKSSIGSAMKNMLSIAWLKSEVFFPLPPLKEQERIVKKVDELMALCDKLEQEEEKLFALDEHFADTLPKSILQYTVEGKLVPQNIHDEPASLLYDKIIKEKESLIKQGKIKKEKPLPPITDDETPYDIPENWKWVRLGEIAIVNGGYAFKSALFKKDGIRVIRISDFNENGLIDKHIVRYEYFDKLNEYMLNKNNIILCMTGGTVGKSLLITAITEPMVTNQRVATIKIRTVYEKYIYYIILSNLIQNIIQKAKLSTNDNISLDTINNFPIPLPPLKEQERIVKKVDELLTYCNKLKDII